MCILPALEFVERVGIGGNGIVRTTMSALINRVLLVREGRIVCIRGGQSNSREEC
jgi:hypothetical protein